MLDSNAFGVWSFIAKRAFKAVFERASSEEAAESISRSLREREVALYIHIPFCTGTCLFCPYVRYPIARSEVERVLS
ncbi:MAG: hypothetical protein OWQ48_04090 [Desulfurococcus sp.]|nr:hypothetical protein [Desulfurococcus sp.]